MAFEHYRLIFSGERTGHYAKLPLEQHLKLLKLSDKAKQRVINGGKIAIKSGLSLTQMREHKAKLLRVGLVTEHQIQLSPASLAAGLRRRKSSDDEQALPINVLDSELASPSVLRRPAAAEISRVFETGSTVSEESSLPLSVDWHEYQFGSLLLIAFAAFLTLTLQIYVISLAGAIGLGATLQSVIGVVFLLAGVATLPKLFQPLGYCHVANDAEDLELFEQPEWILGKKRFIWEADQASGEMSIAPKKALLFADDLIFEWSPKFSTHVSGADSVEDIRNSLTQGTILEPLQIALSRLKPLLSSAQGDRVKAFEDWVNASASAVIDQQGQPIALIYDGETLAYQILRPELQRNLALHGFCLMILRRGLV